MARWEEFSLGIVALYHRARGHNVRALQWLEQSPRQRPDPATWNTGPRGRGPGSQNKAIMQAAAAGDIRYLAQPCRVWGREGIWSREFRSDVYLRPVADSLVVAHNTGRGTPEDQAVIADALRATIALLTLLSRSEPTTEQHIVGPTAWSGRGPHWSIQPTVAHIGSRMLKSPGSSLGEFLALALDLTRANVRYGRRIETLPESPPRFESRDSYRLPDLGSPTVVAATGGRRYEDPIPPEKFGLQVQERFMLTRALKGDHEARSWALEHFKIAGHPIGVWHGYKSLTIQHDDRAGSMIACLGGTGNNMKPDIPACSFSNRQMVSYRPSKYKRLGGRKPKIEWVGNDYLLDGTKVLSLQPEREGVQTLRIGPAERREPRKTTPDPLFKRFILRPRRRSTT